MHARISKINILLSSTIQLFVCFGLALGCDQQLDDPPLVVYAAASLSNVLPEVIAEFETRQPDTKILTNFAASSLLAKQIERGARADIYISANIEWMDYLENQGHIKSGSRINLLQNELVLVAASNGQTLESPQQLLTTRFQTLALADWGHVPAGVYAKQALENMGIWERLAPRLISALDVRAALAYVERGEADYGIVYRSDVAIGQNLKVAATFPADAQPEILYPVAQLASSNNVHGAELVKFLTSETASRIFELRGFQTLSNR